MVDITSYERQRDRLREELTFAQIDRHAESIDELDVEGILAFAERVPPRASDLSVSNSLSGRPWELDQVPAVGDPTHMVQLGSGQRVPAGEGQRCVAFQ